uniref:Ig-like domain-containing protein n=1 Tax=Gopherus evgoodei TaxID=1825980 RepID=A0A8C4WR82_9SAUR
MNADLLHPTLLVRGWVESWVAAITLTQPSSAEAEPGNSITLDCTVSGYALDWYQEQLGKQARFLIGRFSYGLERKSSLVAPRFSARLDTGAKTVKLTIEGAQRADSAVYFCYEKLIFGKGTKVTVEPKHSPPSVFVVKSEKPKPSDGNKLTAACLVKDFYPKNVQVSMSQEKDLVYKSKEGILSSNGKYSMIQVVKVEPNEEVDCYVTHEGKTYNQTKAQSGTVIWSKCEFYHRFPAAPHFMVRHSPKLKDTHPYPEMFQ